MYFIPYKANEFLENSFFQVPKELFVNQYYTDLSLASKVLYGLLLDRLSLSIKNKWTDKDGDIYIIFSRKEAQEKLNLSDKTVTKAFKELKNKIVATAPPRSTIFSIILSVPSQMKFVFGVKYVPVILPFAPLQTIYDGFSTCIRFLYLFCFGNLSFNIRL